MYKNYQNKVSLRGFCKLIKVSRWRLRYYLATEQQRQKRQARLEQEQQQVKDIALKHKTYGYRGIYIELNKFYALGREKVRQHMVELGLQQARPKKKRKAASEFSKVCDLPAGRRVQIDATRFALDDGIAWKYVVEDVSSRACLAMTTVRALSKEAAATALAQAKRVLSDLGISTNLVVQSDAGSDFTSEHFQTTCLQLGSWHRCRINQKGGMGILERLNRTIKWDFVFHHEPETLTELQKLDKVFIRWYNHERIHSAINYQTPWQKLLEDATLSLPVG